MVMEEKARHAEELAQARVQALAQALAATTTSILPGPMRRQELRKSIHSLVLIVCRWQW